MTLPENVFSLSKTEDFPTEEQGDYFGTVLYFSPVHGWMAESYIAAAEMISDLKCTHWTFTPTHPS
jgi:hypothetical protein